MAEPRTWRIDVAGCEWLTANRNSRYRYGAREWRDAVIVACTKARLPKGVGPVTISAIAFYADRPPVRDRLNLAPTIKAIVDGLTEPKVSTRAGIPHTRGGYGLIPDDSDRWVHDTDWALQRSADGRPWVQLTITEVAAS